MEKRERDRERERERGKEREREKEQGTKGGAKSVCMLVQKFGYLDDGVTRAKEVRVRALQCAHYAIPKNQCVHNSKVWKAPHNNLEVPNEVSSASPSVQKNACMHTCHLTRRVPTV